MRSGISVFLIVILFSACLKPPPSYPAEPSITFRSLSKDYVNEYDTLSITLQFTDGDGNLGPTSGSVPSCGSICDLESDSSCLKDPAWSLFMLDHRDSCLTLLNIPFVEPKGKYDDLSGEIIFSTPPMSCKIRGCSPSPGCPDDTVIYTVLLKDRSGNMSNAVQTGRIIINCQ